MDVLVFARPNNHLEGIGMDKGVVSWARSKSKWFLLVMLFVLGSQAKAHGPIAPFPLHVANPFLIGHHAFIANHAAFASSHALGNLLTKQIAHNNLLPTSRISGLSGSAGIYRNEVKLYTGQGIIAGIVGQFNKGNISTGQLVGTTYFQFYGSTQTHVTNTLNIAFGGSNPFAGANAPSSVASIGPTASFSVSQSKSGGIGFVAPLRLTGTQRIVQNQLNGIILNGVKEGRLIGATGLTGGYIGPATIYLTVSPGHFTSDDSPYGYAFGNSPLNTNVSSAILNGVLPNQPSYLNFVGKINIPIDSAFLYGNIYNGPPGALSLNPFSPFVFVAGNNPFNVLTPAFNATFFNTSYLRLKFPF
jgi:hypothetical protein